MLPPFRNLNTRVIDIGKKKKKKKIKKKKKKKKKKSKKKKKKKKKKKMKYMQGGGLQLVEAQQPSFTCRLVKGCCCYGVFELDGLCSISVSIFVLC